MIVKPIINKDNKNLYELVETLTITYNDLNIRVPKYFQYDGASIPALMWPFIGSPFDPNFMRAAIYHDWFYRTHKFDRKTTDKLLYDLLRADNVSRIKASLIYWAVRIFGKPYWKNDAEDIEYLKNLQNKVPDCYFVIPNED